MPPRRRNQKLFSKKHFLQKRQEEEEKIKHGDAYYKKKGVDAFNSEEFVAALNYFTKAIELNKTDPILYSNRSATYIAIKKYNKALDDAKKIIELKKDWAKGFYRKGCAYENLLRYKNARDAYQNGLKIDPKNPLLLNAMHDLSLVLDDLKITEEELSQDNPDSDKFRGMVKWLRNGGTKFSKLYLQYYGHDYRGVHCLTKIPRQEVILFVPFKYIMTSEVAKASSIGRKIINSKVNIRSSHSYLASYLLQEKHRKQSFWDPYLNILPSHYANMPIFFKEDLLVWLKGSFSLEKISDRIDCLRVEYDNIRGAVKEFNKYHLEDFVWARLVVITRIFGLQIDKKRTDGLVPYADMLNHKIPNETSWTFDNSRYGFIITTLKTYRRGDEVFDSYGRKCNHRYFVNYGFTMDINKDNEALIQVALDPKDPHYRVKRKIMGGQDYLMQREYQIPADYTTKKTKEFFSFMRFIHTRDAEIRGNSSNNDMYVRRDMVDGFQKNDIAPISIRNETALLKTIYSVCQKHLEAFPDSLEDDYELLKSGDLKMYSNERNSVIMRRGEKEVLTWFIKLSSTALQLFQMSLKELEKITAKYSRIYDNIGPYVKNVVLELVKRER